MSVRWVRVGDVLNLERERIDVDPAVAYRQIGVYSWGKGIIERDPVPGHELSKLSYYQFPSNALILSNIQAWEAAIAVSNRTHTGFIASQRFLPYVPHDTDEVDVRYLLDFFLSDPGMALIRQASPGSVTRNRTLGIKAFENLRIPLPDIERQRSIARQVESLVSVSTSFGSRPLQQAEALCDRVERSVIESSGQFIPLSSMAEVNPRAISVKPNTLVHFVPMADVDADRGRIRGQTCIEKSKLTSTYKQFSPGDIIFARITPCMQNGKSAVFVGDCADIGYGSTEFHVLRPTNSMLSPRIHTLLRTKWFRTQAMAAFTGTAGQQRVPAGYLQKVTIPDVSGQHGEVMVDKLIELDARRRELRDLDERRKLLAKTLPQAARNEIFAELTR